MEDKLELKEGSIFLFKDIKSVLQEVYDHYRDVKNYNEYLQKENERLKSETYKDEELSKMKSEYDNMKEKYYRGFPISEEESEKIKQWMYKHDNNFYKDTKIVPIGGRYTYEIGTISGRYTYEFQPTSLGTIGTIIDTLTGDKLTFRDCDSW